MRRIGTSHVAALLLPLLLAACGRPREGPAPAAVLAALDARSAVLTGPAAYPGWMATGIEPLREGLALVRRGDPSVRAVSRGEARRRALAAQVVLVLDLHDLDPCRRGFARAVQDLAPVSLRRASLVGVALESVPLSLESAVREARGAPGDGGPDDPLSAALAAAWPWPVLATARLLRLPGLRPCPLLGAGRVAGAGAPPLPVAPDAERRPGFDPQHLPTLEEFKYGTDFHRGNDHAVARVVAWLGEARSRRVFVLYGAAHHLGANNLRRRLQDAGFAVLVLVPFLPEWEAALRRRFGRAVEHTWYEVLPGVLRPPYVTDAEILALRAGAVPTLELPR